jgi:hypothetical protein
MRRVENSAYSHYLTLSILAVKVRQSGKIKGSNLIQLKINRRCHGRRWRFGGFNSGLEITAGAMGNQPAVPAAI